jgi:hypothetical protein
MSISRKDIERVKTHLTAKDFEFVYLDFYPVKKGNTYNILYTKDKEEFFIDWVGNRILPLKRTTLTLFTQYKRSRKGKFKREVYIKSFTYQLTGRQRKKGVVPRYFAQYVFDQSQTIFEIRKLDFSQRTELYKKVSILWTIKGSKEKVKELNERELEFADGRLKGMRYHLDPLEFYREEDTPEEVKMKRIQKLLHNPHGYSHQLQASSTANALGLSGTHKMSDGTWMPGVSHREYLQVMKKDKIKTPAGNIPTRNLRNTSGY